MADRLTTPRLILRRHARSDAAALARLLNNWNVVRWLAQVPYPYGERDALDWIGQCHRSWAAGAEYQFVVTLAAGGPLVGHIGLRLDAARQGAELGYWFGEPHWGHGYGTEAARATVGFAFHQLRLDRIWATALPSNGRSLAVLGRAGLKQVGTKLQEFAVLGEMVEVPLLSLTRADYLATPSAS